MRMPTIAVSARPADVVIASKHEWISRSLASIHGPQGYVDEVTGVYNVRGLTLRAREWAAQATRRHSALCCVLLAPDTEPDAGAGGDGRPSEAPLWLVRGLATALRAAARQSDAIGRLDANAFAVVAVDTDAAQARRLAERLATAILAEADSPFPALHRFR